MTDIVMGAPLGHVGHHRERRLRAGQRLHLGLLVHAIDDGSLVGSDRGAVTAFRLIRFPGPPSEPDVRVSTHPALHVTVPLVYAAVSFVAHGVGMVAPR